MERQNQKLGKMNNIKIIHEAAMEFMDMAKRAKSLGKPELHQNYMEKAFVLEQEAALTLPEQPHNFMWKYILLRSAASLAFQAGLFSESKKLVEFALKGNPPSIEKAKLEALLKQISQKNLAKEITKSTSKISGILSVADVLNCKIILNENGTNKKIVILVDENKIRDIARLFIGDMVEIETRKQDSSTIFLERIRRFA